VNHFLRELPRDRFGFLGVYTFALGIWNFTDIG